MLKQGDKVTVTQEGLARHAQAVPVDESPSSIEWRSALHTRKGQPAVVRENVGNRVEIEYPDGYVVLVESYVLGTYVEDTAAPVKESKLYADRDRVLPTSKHNERITEATSVGLEIARRKSVHEAQDQSGEAEPNKAGYYAHLLYNG